MKCSETRVLANGTRPDMRHCPLEWHHFRSELGLLGRVRVKCQSLRPGQVFRDNSHFVVSVTAGNAVKVVLFANYIIITFSRRGVSENAKVQVSWTYFPKHFLPAQGEMSGKCQSACENREGTQNWNYPKEYRFLYYTVLFIVYLPSFKWWVPRLGCDSLFSCGVIEQPQIWESGMFCMCLST